MKNNLLLSPDPAEGGSPGTAEAGEETQQTQEQPSTDVLEEQPSPGAADNAQGDVDTQGGEASAAATGGTGITKEDIEAILERVMPAAVAAGKSEEPAAAVATAPTYTQEQYDQMFNVYKPTADLLTRMRSEDPQVALKALAEMQQGLIKQAMTMAEYRMQQYRDSILKKYGDDLAPIQSFVTEQQATSFRNDFFKDYPDLEPYETIVDAVAAKLQGQGWQGKDRKDVMKRFADESQAVVQTLLAKAGGNGAAASGKKVVAFPATDKKRMSTLTGGGQGGTSRPGASQGSAKGPAGIEIFD